MNWKRISELRLEQLRVFGGREVAEEIGRGRGQAGRVERFAAPQARILILTMHDDEGYLRQALRAGASGYVLKKAADSELLSAWYAKA